MHSSTSSSSAAPAAQMRVEHARPGFVRLTASDRPGVAQPVPERDIPQHPWRAILASVVVLTALALAAWEWRMRALQLLPGDLGDSGSAWAEQRRRINTGNIPIAIVGDSRILFDTDIDRFEALTGVRPLQLAVVGANARPYLQSLADDADFKGLAIVGISELSYFHEKDFPGRKSDALKTYAFESPSSRISLVLQRGLSRVFGFLDEEYRLSKLVRRLDPGLRAGVTGPFGEPWKMTAAGDGRATWMWPRLTRDARLLDHAQVFFRGSAVLAGEPVKEDAIAMTLDKARAAVAAIRAHGGDVIFVRPPSDGNRRTIEDRRLPRTRGWEPLLAAADVRGIHFDDEPAMQGLVLPENSHLTRECASVFTDSYVRRLVQLTPRVSLRSDAPPMLQPSYCTAP